MFVLAGQSLSSAPIAKYQQLPAVDLLAQALRKGAAKCDKHCDARDPVNHQTPERTLYFQDLLEVIQLQGHETIPSEGNSLGKVGGPIRDPVLVMTVLCVVLKTKGCEVRLLAATPLLKVLHRTGLGAFPQPST